MKMDGRGSAEYQIWETKDITVIMEFDFKSLKDKIVNSHSSPSLSQKKNVGGGGGGGGLHFEIQWLHF